MIKAKTINNVLEEVINNITKRKKSKIIFVKTPFSKKEIE